MAHGARPAQPVSRRPAVIYLGVAFAWLLLAVVVLLVTAGAARGGHHEDVVLGYVQDQRELVRPAPPARSRDGMTSAVGSRPAAGPSRRLAATD